MKKEKMNSNQNKINKFDKFDLTNAGSVNECTGLITVPAQNEDELENYKHVYDFGPPSK